MPRFAQNIIAALQAEPRPRDAADDILAAGDCLSKSRMVNFHTGGLFPDLDVEGVSDEEAKLIEYSLVRIYAKHKEEEGIASVIWALTKARNPDLKPLFLQHASFAMKKMMSAYSELSQAAIGLDDFEHIENPSKGRSQVIAEAIDLADAHLLRAGIIIPVG